MRHVYQGQNSFLVAFCLITSAVALASCSTGHQDQSKIYVRDRTEYEAKLPDLLSREDDFRNFGHIDAAATMAADVYGRDAECVETANKSLSGWQNKPELESVRAAPAFLRYHTDGLLYKVWVKQEASKTLAMIVFRGSRPAFSSWYSNFRWMTRFIPLVKDEYWQTRDITERLYAGIKAAYPNAEVMAAGHSLGGGLAQQIAYAAKPPGIKTVFAFDPSPVTGYLSVPTNTRNEAQQGMSIYRAYEFGEVLSPLRDILGVLVPRSHENPRIVELRFNIVDADRPTALHAMAPLACNLPRLRQGEEPVPTSETPVQAE